VLPLLLLQKALQARQHPRLQQPLPPALPLPTETSRSNEKAGPAPAFFMGDASLKLLF
jgi:hypothetical protein